MKRFSYFLGIALMLGIINSTFFGCGLGSPAKIDSAQVAITKTVNSLATLHPVIIEVITSENLKYTGQELGDAKWLAEIGAHVTRWRNHTAIFAMVNDAVEFADNIKKNWHGVYDSVKVYDKPFYKFDRSHCVDTVTSKQWTNIFLTANLVADLKLQQEYLDHHKTQFEKWPEVSQGFCNASFQQLLVFKTGRQLMLVISIPKGESLDKLNPLTTKNNPRVDDWNKLMSKYQEGIPGTKKGETWVFLKPVGR